MNRRFFAGLVVVLASAGVGGWWWISRPPATGEWQGYAEADFVKVAPTQAGLLTAVRIVRGDNVVLGTPLFDQDETSDFAARDQAERQLDQAARQLANLQAPGRSTEIQQAEANLADAKATRDRTQADLLRIDKLLSSSSASVQSRDQSRADFLSAEAKVRSLEAVLAQLRSATGRDEEIRAQISMVEAARAAVTMAQWRLAQRRVAAPAAGVVADVLARSGETVAAGAPVVSLLPPENIFIRFFVPETMLARVHRGDRVAFSCDNGPTGLVGTVSFIAPKAEYTPPLIYSDENRAKLVFMIEARPRPEQAALFNPGQPVTVRSLGLAPKQ
jgi:HlyD family secretion protein